MKSSLARPPPAVLAGLAGAVVLDTIIQISWKLAASRVPAGADIPATLLGVLPSRYFLIAMLAFAAQLWNWLRVLARADLSYAQPFTALSYLTVLGLSAGMLQERSSGHQAAGVGLILLGVGCISRTPYQTPPAGQSGLGQAGEAIR